MLSVNDAVRIKRALLVKLLKGFLTDGFETKIDRLPVELRPHSGEASRCCIYKDRAVLKYRIMAMLGFGIEDETDETRPLSEYLKDARIRKKPDEHVLSVLDVACSGCIESQYLVTNACRGCFARPCVSECPKGAVKIVAGQAEINHRLCIDCGRCTRVCPYHAIIRVPIPCEEACPVNAIRKDNATRKQYIDFDACVSCGKCMAACPFGAILERSQIMDVMLALQNDKQVVAMLAPSIIGQFNGRLGQIFTAALQAGFDRVEEVAYGAEKTTEAEVKEFFERRKKQERLMTSSCCPAYTETVKRHVPDLVSCLSRALSPMRCLAAEIKLESPGCVTVFIGPCVAKRKEALTDKNIDFVMTFEELGALFEAMKIEPATLEEMSLPREVEGYARGFATSCGVNAAMLAEAAKDIGDGQQAAIDAKCISGLDRKAVKQLELFGLGKLPGDFLEVMACEGGCVGGPCVIGDVQDAASSVRELATEIHKS